MTIEEHNKLMATLNHLKAAKENSKSGSNTPDADREAMVPIGKFALFKGQLQNPTRVFFDAQLNGNLKEVEINEAISIVERKLKGKPKSFVPFSPNNFYINISNKN